MQFNLYKVINMEKFSLTLQRIFLYFFTGALFLNILYRLTGYSLTLWVMLFNNGYITYNYGPFNELFKLVYFEESLLLFAVISVIGFWITAALIPLISKNILTRRSRIFFGLSAVLPVVFPQAIPFPLPEAVWAATFFAGIAGFTAYIIFGVIFIKRDTQSI